MFNFEFRRFVFGNFGNVYGNVGNVYIIGFISAYMYIYFIYIINDYMYVHKYQGYVSSPGTEEAEVNFTEKP